MTKREADQENTNFRSLRKLEGEANHDISFISERTYFRAPTSRNRITRRNFAGFDVTRLLSLFIRARVKGTMG